MPHQICKFAVVLFLALVPAANVSAQLNFSFNINPNLFDEETMMSTGVITAAEQSALSDALDGSADFWGQFITGFQPSVTGITGVTLDIGLSNFATDNGMGMFEPDGPGQVLASAGPGGFVSNNGGFTFLTNAGGDRLTGQVTIDSADFVNLDSQIFIDTLNHEIGHALGFGTLFDFGLNQVAIDGTGQYTGEAGLAAYRDEFDPDATFIPIELDGGPGTANAHLNQFADLPFLEDFEGVAPDGTPIFDPDGEDDPGDIADSAPTVLLPGPTFGNSLDDDLLTGVLTVTPSGDTTTFLSNTTVATFADIGFTVVLPNPPAAIPEPSSLVMFMTLGCVGLLRRSRRELV